MNELMIHVEKIVRPIRGDSSKLRMRRELLAHLHASFEQERSRGSDEPTAIAEAKRRLGDPALLMQELQNSVPTWERLAATPFPKTVTVAVAVISVIAPAFLAVIPLRGIPALHARWVFAAGLAVMELDFLLWYVFVRAILRPRTHWSRTYRIGASAFVLQFVWLSLVTLGLSGKWMFTEFSNHALEYLIPSIVYLLLGPVVALMKLPVKQWHALEIAD